MLWIFKEKAEVSTFSKYCEFWSRSTSSVDVICCRSNRIVSITTTLQKKLVEIERCKDISLKIEQQELSYSPGRINMVSFRVVYLFHRSCLTVWEHLPIMHAYMCTRNIIYVEDIFGYIMCKIQYWYGGTIHIQISPSQH